MNPKMVGEKFATTSVRRLGKSGKPVRDSASVGRWHLAAVAWAKAWLTTSTKPSICTEKAGGWSRPQNCMSLESAGSSWREKMIKLDYCM